MIDKVKAMEDLGKAIDELLPLYKALEAENKRLAEALKIALEGLTDANNYMTRGGIPPVFISRIEHINQALAQRIKGE